MGTGDEVVNHIPVQRCREAREFEGEVIVRLCDAHAWMETLASLGTGRVFCSVSGVRVALLI